MEVRIAKKSGVNTPVVQAMIEQDNCALSQDLAKVYVLAEVVVTRNGPEDEYRDAILRRYGEIGLVESSLAVAACRLFPTNKRALGYTIPCVPSNTNVQRMRPTIHDLVIQGEEECRVGGATAFRSPDRRARPA
jgi:hypothetical protein